MGVQVAMDDFGMGYSSLFMLKHIPADIVKIDRGFVKGITTDLFNATFIRSITSCAMMWENKSAWKVWRQKRNTAV